MTDRKGQPTTKYAMEDGPRFYEALRSRASNLMERGTVRILQSTGMHVSSLVALTEKNLLHQGDDWFIEWRAPKKQRRRKALRARIPVEDVEDIRAWITRYGGRRTTRQLCRVITDLGARAGYPGISPMTFRHQRIVQLLIESKGNVVLVQSRTGASQATIIDHYSQASMEGDTK